MTANRGDPRRARGRGARFETAAEVYLVARGWEVLERNYRDGPREIDRIVHRAGVVAFVEVKGRAMGAAGHPLESIGRRKRSDIERAAARWLRERFPRCGLGRCTFRFDAVGLIEGPRGEIELLHVPDGWRRGE